MTRFTRPSIFFVYGGDSVARKFNLDWCSIDLWFENSLNPENPWYLPDPLLITPPKGKLLFKKCAAISFMHTAPELVSFLILPIKVLLFENI